MFPKMIRLYQLTPGTDQYRAMVDYPDGTHSDLVVTIPEPESVGAVSFSLDNFSFTIEPLPSPNPPSESE